MNTRITQQEILNRDHIILYGTTLHIAWTLRQILLRNFYSYNNNRVITPGCNAGNRTECPLRGNCLDKSVVYCGKVTISKGNGKNYIGVTENTWKDRNYKHRNSYNDPTKKNDTGLSKYIWDLKGKGVKMEDIKFEWSIIDHATPFINSTHKCNLCLTEKFHIIKTSLELINKRLELISKCCHENKFYLMNFKEHTLPHEWVRYYQWPLFYMIFCYQENL